MRGHTEAAGKTAVQLICMQYSACPSANPPPLSCDLVGPGCVFCTRYMGRNFLSPALAPSAPRQHISAHPRVSSSFLATADHETTLAQVMGPRSTVVIPASGILAIRYNHGQRGHQVFRRSRVEGQGRGSRVEGRGWWSLDAIAMPCQPLHPWKETLIIVKTREFSTRKTAPQANAFRHPAVIN